MSTDLAKICENHLNPVMLVFHHLNLFSVPDKREDIFVYADDMGIRHYGQLCDMDMKLIKVTTTYYYASDYIDSKKFFFSCGCPIKNY